MFYLNSARTIITVLLLLATFGCADVPKALEDDEPSSEPTPMVYVDKNRDEKAALTGRTVYVQFDDKALLKVLKLEQLNELKNKITAYVRGRGFNLVDKRAKAHSEVYFSADILSEMGGLVETTVYTKIVDGKVTANKKEVKTSDIEYQRLHLAWYVNSYARRPKTFFRLTISSQKPLNSVWGNVNESLFENLDGLETDLPKENPKAKGDPGCIPRFGFDVKAVSENGSRLFKVNKIEDRSPAQKIGMKVGDIIESIDSIPYGEWNQSEPVEVYEKSIEVPMKLKRNGQTIRTTIRAQIMCN